MYVIPITTGNYINPIQQVGTNSQIVPGGANFSDYFKSALQDWESIEAQKANDSYLLSIGEIDDIAKIELTAQKAQTMMTMLVQVRNTLMDGYNEIMRMNV